MSLIVEDGTGRADAESYCSEAAADSYHAARMNVTWSALASDAKEAALRNATDYLSFTYSGCWAGSRASLTQALDWPRTDVPYADSVEGGAYRPHDAVPAELVKATAELALRAKDGPLVMDLGRETVSEAVDVIRVTYKEGGERQTQYAAAEGWLRSLLDFGSGSRVPTSRA